MDRPATYTAFVRQGVGLPWLKYSLGLNIVSLPTDQSDSANCLGYLQLDDSAVCEVAQSTRFTDRLLINNLKFIIITIKRLKL